MLDLSEDISASDAVPTWATVNFEQEGFFYPTGTKFNLQETTTYAEIIVPDSAVNGNIKNLVFAWKQDFGGGNSIGVEIDDISIVHLDCVPPTDVNIAEGGIQTNSITFDLETESGEEWEIQYMVYGAETWESYIASSSFMNVSASSW